ncbi:HD domain-containing protein [Massilia pinisoli]|uniref:HD domain-containing protein n=1 Tax=Massilia pinisoli TaxID=1772194 RepID=A0ABT1ZWJ9_9BURK|nr:HD domain-containing protein [Massilia pinisoli]MCS0584315.1 HD domain-containing protein [Massilia pinisoli]
MQATTRSLPPELDAWRPRLAQLAAAALAEQGPDGAHDLNHFDRVWRNAQALLVDYPQADPLVVLAACYLHDLVNVPKDDARRSSASRLSAELARERLAALDFPTDKLAGVAHAIEAHSFSAAVPATTVEARIVQDADRLDGLGAVGLARMFYIAGRMGSALAHGLDPLARARPLDDKTYALDHIDAKLARLPGMMQTDAGRALAEQRLATLTDFRAAFAAEWTGTD